MVLNINHTITSDELLLLFITIMSASHSHDENMRFTTNSFLLTI